MKQRDHFRLNKGEEVLGGSDNQSAVFDEGGFILTNQRVIKVDRSPLGGDTVVHTISLEKLDSMQTVASKPIILLVIGVIAFVSSLVLGTMEGAILGLVLLSGFVIAYFLWRRKVIRFVSGSSEMALLVTAMAHNQIQELVFAVEKAKQARLDALTRGDDSRSVGESRSGNKSASERIAELDTLRDGSLISTEEYSKKREQILGEL
jgi:hypothetical protein